LTYIILTLWGPNLFFQLGCQQVQLGIGTLTMLESILNLYLYILEVETDLTVWFNNVRVKARSYEINTFTVTDILARPPVTL
jgi:hypothetical protein